MWLKIKKEIVGLVRKYFPSLEISEDDFVFPPNSEFGDLSLPCFSFVKILQNSPPEIAKELGEKILPAGIVGKIVAAGPYLNFFLDKREMASLVLNQILKEKEKFGDSKIFKKEKIMIEYVSPNANKPLHLGHLRNALLGEAMANLLSAVGAKVIRTSLVNDRGAHICKSMVAYNHWGNEKTPVSEKIKGDHFVGKFYVMYAAKVEEDKKLEDETRAMLEKWEAGDKKVVALWKKMTKWALDGFAETYKKLGVKFDKIYFESKIYKEGKKMITDGLAAGKFLKDESGAVITRLGNKLPDKVLLRADGTALYVTQDLYLAKLKFDEYKLTKSIYCVGSEQDLYLKQLFKILEILGYEWAKNLYHLSHGMIYLPEGKMKSRSGTVVDADELMDKLENYAAEEIKSRHADLSDKEKQHRALEIALAALKYFILQVDPETDMHFDPKKSLSFSGRTGPYLEYSHARICSIIRKAGIKISGKVDFDKLREKWEYNLVVELAKFPEILEKAARAYNPAVLADYLYDLAKIFSDFYRDVKVIGADPEAEKARIALIGAVRIVLSKGLAILGMAAPEEM